MGADLPAVIGVLTGFCLVVVVPVVAILTTHQRKMAELMRQRPDADTRSQQQLDLLQAQINDLRNQLHEHIVRTDSLPPAQEQTPPPLHERLNG